jgi:inorganic pyrophosphatase
MHNVTNIINELNENNSSNYKLEVLKKHKDDLLLQRVLKMTSDKAVYNYGVGKKTLKKTFRNDYGLG